MRENELIEDMKIIAEENEVDLTENAEKIASFRAKRGIGLGKCVCEPNNPYRGCISSLCMSEIKENGICHCRCFKKRV